MAGTTILSITYGIEVQPENDPFVEIAEESLHAMACTANAGSYLVDQFPILKHIPEFFPGAGFKTQAKHWNKVVSAMPIVTFDFVKDSMVRSGLYVVDHSVDLFIVFAAFYVGKRKFRTLYS
jgi:hypothetical protein